MCSASSNGQLGGASQCIDTPSQLKVYLHYKLCQSDPRIFWLCLSYLATISVWDQNVNAKLKALGWRLFDMAALLALVQKVHNFRPHFDSAAWTACATPFNLMSCRSEFWMHSQLSFTCCFGSAGHAAAVQAELFLSRAHAHRLHWKNEFPFFFSGV